MINDNIEHKLTNVNNMFCWMSKQLAHDGFLSFIYCEQQNIRSLNTHTEVFVHAPLQYCRSEAMAGSSTTWEQERVPTVSGGGTNGRWVW